MKFSTLLTASAMALAAVSASAQEKTINIAGFGASSGVVGIFGQNSGAAMAAAIEKINADGGIA